MKLYWKIESACDLVIKAYRDLKYSVLTLHAFVGIDDIYYMTLIRKLQGTLSLNAGDGEHVGRIVATGCVESLYFNIALNPKNNFITSMFATKISDSFSRLCTCVVGSTGACRVFHSTHGQNMTTYIRAGLRVPPELVAFSSFDTWTQHDHLHTGGSTSISRLVSWWAQHTTLGIL